MPPTNTPNQPYNTMPEATPLIAGILPYLQDDLQDRVMQAFTYEFQFASFTNTGQATISLDNISHFICTSMQAQVWTGANPPTAVSPAPMTLQINDTGSGQYIAFPNIVGAMLGNWSGTGQLPFQFTVPRQFSAASQLQAILTAFDNSRAFTAYISLSGAKIFGTYRDGSPGGVLPPLTY